MTTTQTHRTNVRRLIIDGEPMKIQATYGISVTNWAYFAVTGHAWKKHASTSTDPSISGQMRPDILRAFPDLPDIVDMHMCNATTGEPVHAEANGWYSLTTEGPESAARTLRTTPDRLEGVTTREQFAALIEELRGEWSERAKALRDKYGLTA